MSKASNSTKNRIVNTAWKLFYKKGYENTTIDDIVEAAHISKGSFYHYFKGKDSLIASITYLLDEQYETLVESLNPNLDAAQKLVRLTQESFFTVENTVPVRLLSQVLASQLNSRAENTLLDPDRTYFRIVRQIVVEGKEKGLFREDFTVNEIVISYSMMERGLMYDWCISNGNYPLAAYSAKMMRAFLKGFIN